MLPRIFLTSFALIFREYLVIFKYITSLMISFSRLEWCLLISIIPSLKGIPLALHGERPSSRSSQRSSGGTLTCAFTRRPSSAGSRGPLVPASRAGAARAAAILLISCHRQSIKGGNKHRRALSDVAEGSTDGLGRRTRSLFCASVSVFVFATFFMSPVSAFFSRTDEHREFHS